MPRARKPRRPMSAFVLTLAACGGSTGSTGATGEPILSRNPPARMVADAPPLAIGDRFEIGTDGECVHHPANGERVVQPGCPTEFGPGTLTRGPDGTCRYMAHVDCPPPSVATCNPPPPQIVPCPAGSAPTPPPPEISTNPPPPRRPEINVNPPPRRYPETPSDRE